MCRDFESRSEKNIKHLAQRHPLPYNGSTEAEYGATQKSETKFDLMHGIASEYESSFLSLILEANLSIAFDADQTARPVHEKINEQKVAFSTSIILRSYFSFFVVLGYLQESQHTD